MATKNIVPRANHEGQIGTSAKSWSKVYATGIIGDMIAGSGTGGTFDTFSATDTTPSVSTGNLFKTHASTQTLSMFDDGTQGQLITVISTAAVTFDVTSTNLKGGTTDIVTASGDVTRWVFDGTNWYLLAFMDMSDDLSGGL